MSPRPCVAPLFETHFHDNLGPVGEPGPQGFGDMHLPLGLGTIDWLGVAAAIDEINYAGPITFEGQYRFFGDTPEGFFRGVDVSMANWRAVEDLAAR